MNLSRLSVPGAVLAAMLSFPVLPVAASSPNDAILVLDASGSMWGQIDGVNKIVIAKDVVEGLVLGLPPEQRLGLVADAGLPQAGGLRYSGVRWLGNLRCGSLCTGQNAGTERS